MLTVLSVQPDVRALLQSKSCPENLVPAMPELEDMEHFVKRTKRTVWSASAPSLVKGGPLGTRDLCRDRANLLRFMRRRPTAAVLGKLLA